MMVEGLQDYQVRSPTLANKGKKGWTLLVFQLIY